MSPDAFRSWRRRLDMTQAEAAERLGISRRMVQDYEAGKYPVPRYIELACETVSARADAKASG